MRFKDGLDCRIVDLFAGIAARHFDADVRVPHLVADGQSREPNHGWRRTGRHERAMQVGEHRARSKLVVRAVGPDARDALSRRGIELLDHEIVRGQLDAYVTSTRRDGFGLHLIGTTYSQLHPYIGDCETQRNCR